MKRLKALFKPYEVVRSPLRISTKTSILQIEGHTIPIEIRKSSKAHRLTLSYCPGQHIRITAPYHTSSILIQALINDKKQRILDYYLSSSDSIISSNADLCDHSRGHFETHKQSALEFCTRKVEQRNKKLGRTYQKITVKSFKTKRGSCSSRGNLNFNYKLMFLPEPMADYVIVHELCHLREMNHGPQFWKLVEEVYGPEWKQWKKIR